MLHKRFGDSTAIIPHGKHDPSIDSVRCYMDLPLIMYRLIGINLNVA